MSPRRRAILAGLVLASWYSPLARRPPGTSPRGAVPEHSPLPADATVDALPSGRVVLERSADSERPGVYGSSGRAATRSPAPCSGGTATR